MTERVKQFRINSISKWMQEKGYTPPQGETYKSFAEQIVTYKRIVRILDAKEIEAKLEGVSIYDFTKRVSNYAKFLKEN